MKIKEYKVDIENISVNPKYQRPLNETWVKKLVKTYDDSRVNQLVLSATPEGKYYVIDGQHTVEATRRVKGEHVLLPAKVFFGLTEKEEADLFYTYNTERKALSSNDKIRARYASGEPLVVDYFDCLDYAGVTWSFDTVGVRNHAATIRTFYATDKDSAIRAMVIYKDAKYIDFSSALSGLMWLIYKHKEIDDERLTKKLLSMPQEELKRIVFSVNTAAGISPFTIQKPGGRADHSVPMNTTLYARALAYVYNKGVRTNKIDLATI